ncbi:MAG TPA: hypothetical protein VE954_15195 [Oligoflexus sp.]|uniref:hypothetical protein n=1 Tax=Oligoflexus sp. TaxID=1971216 RepID=UPI002D40AF91|nr:hypothetical protein [Oligoflexus sp.]HYX34449.1 hypothetical protein [Oligoflexus sp.]
MDSNDSNINDFISLVLTNLTKNGFPDKAVSFPLEKMYQSASQRGFSFNKVRDILREQGVETELTEERVIFTEALTENAGLNDFDLQQTAAQIFQQMSPEQRAEIARMMQDIPPADLENLKRQWESMSDEEKAQRMEGLEKFMPNT